MLKSLVQNERKGTEVFTSRHKPQRKKIFSKVTANTAMMCSCLRDVIRKYHTSLVAPNLRKMGSCQIWRPEYLKESVDIVKESAGSWWFRW